MLIIFTPGAPVYHGSALRCLDGTGRAYGLNQAGHRAADGKLLLGHHILTDEGLNVILAQRRIVWIGELFLETGCEDRNRLAVDPATLVAAMAFENVELLAEDGTARLITRESRFEILVLGIEEPRVDRFEQALDCCFSGSAPNVRSVGLMTERRLRAVSETVFGIATNQRGDLLRVYVAAAASIAVMIARCNCA